MRRLVNALDGVAGTNAPDWCDLARQIRDLREGYRADPESKAGQEAWNLMADLVEEDGDALLIALAAMEPGAKIVSPGHVALPTNADEAKAMWLIGEQWIRDHAPEMIRTPEPTSPSGGDAGAEAMRERCAVVCEARAAYFDRSPAHRDWRDAARSYRATAKELRALPLPQGQAPRQGGEV